MRGCGRRRLLGASGTRLLDFSSRGLFHMSDMPRKSSRINYRIDPDDKEWLFETAENHAR